MGHESSWNKQAPPFRQRSGPRGGRQGERSASSRQNPSSPAPTGGANVHAQRRSPASGCGTGIHLRPLGPSLPRDPGRRRVWKTPPPCARSRGPAGTRPAAGADAQGEGLRPGQVAPPLAEVAPRTFARELPRTQVRVPRASCGRRGPAVALPPESAPGARGRRSRSACSGRASGGAWRRGGGPARGRRVTPGPGGVPRQAGWGGARARRAWQGRGSGAAARTHLGARHRLRAAGLQRAPWPRRRGPARGGAGPGAGRPRSHVGGRRAGDPRGRPSRWHGLDAATPVWRPAPRSPRPAPRAPGRAAGDGEAERFGRRAGVQTRASGGSAQPAAPAPSHSRASKAPRTPGCSRDRDPSGRGPRLRPRPAGPGAPAPAPGRPGAEVRPLPDFLACAVRMRASREPSRFSGAAGSLADAGPNRDAASIGWRHRRGNKMRI